MNHDALNANIFYNGFDPHVNTRNKGGEKSNWEILKCVTSSSRGRVRGSNPGYCWERRRRERSRRKEGKEVKARKEKEGRAKSRRGQVDETWRNRRPPTQETGEGQVDKTRDDHRLRQHVPVGTTDCTAKTLGGRHELGMSITTINWAWGPKRQVGTIEEVQHDYINCNSTTKTLEHMHKTNCTRSSGTANQQISFRETFWCSQCIMHIIIHSSFDTPYITLIKGEPSHSLRGSKYTPFITFFYPSQLLHLRRSVGLITSNYIVVIVTSELTD